MALLNVCDDALKKTLSLGADEAEIYALSSKEIEVVIEKNDIQLARSQTSRTIGIRVFKNKGLGFASVSDVDNVKEGCRRAVELAGVSPRDEYSKLPSPVELERVPELYDAKSDGFSVKEALEHGVSMLQEAKGYDSRITVERGTFSAIVSNRAIKNSKGVSGEETSSVFIYFIMGMAVDGDQVSSFNYEFDGVRFLGGIDTKRCARDFARKVIDSLGATKGKSFKGKVILSPESVAALIAQPVVFSVNANNVQKGMSQWKEKRGTAVASELLTIVDNGMIPGGLGSSGFDREGIPHSPLTIIENGRLCSYMYNTYTAGKENRKTTGHSAGGASQVPGIGPTNFTINGGDVSKDELIKSIDQGVLVTRFSGFPNPLTGEFSGVAKGGWLIENGKLVTPLKETLIHGNMYESLNKMFAISKEQKKVMTSILPWIGIDGVSVTAG
jgi:PmbA protein